MTRTPGWKLYKARVRLNAYADVTLEAPDEEQASEWALTAALETAYPEVSDMDVDWIEERPEAEVG